MSTFARFQEWWGGAAGKQALEDERVGLIFKGGGLMVLEQGHQAQTTPTLGGFWLGVKAYTVNS